MPYTDLYQKRRYQLEWCRKRRQTAIDLMGGKCKTCKATDNLEFHHRNPDEKESHRIWSWAWARVLEEIAKCDLLCTDCHGKETRKLLAERARHSPRAENGAFMTAEAA